MEKRFYSLSSRIMAERSDYYNILEQNQKGNGDITGWLLWFLGCMQRAIEESQHLIAGVLIKAEFWRKIAGQDFSQGRKKKGLLLLHYGRWRLHYLRRGCNRVDLS